MKYIFSSFNNQDLKNTLNLIFRDLVNDDKSSYEKFISNSDIKQFKKKQFWNFSILSSYLPNNIKKLLIRLNLLNISKSHILVIDKIIDLRLSFMKKSGIESIDGRPKFLVRVDDFPRWDIESKEFKRFDEIFSNNKIPYLLGVIPFLSEDPLNPKCKKFRNLTNYEIEIINNLISEGSEIALHGFSHQTIKKNLHSELIGITKEEIREKISLSLKKLKRFNSQIRVFIPPFNTFDFYSVGILGKYFKIICGGPESIPFVGFRLSPSYLNGNLYIASYVPMYEKANVIYKYIKRLKRLKEQIIIPITLHWAWEINNNFRDVERLAEELKDCTVKWDYLMEPKN